MIIYEELFKFIAEHFEISVEEGRALGIYDAQDCMDMSASVERRHAARIFHLILLKKYGVKDIAIDAASVLLDLYDCRVCVNHIAQVYLRGIMEARLDNIFDGRAAITAYEMKRAVSVIDELIATTTAVTDELTAMI
ncbi:MAG: hypothetical protein MJ104_06740 [Lachnospiraceae bacterium]|nr:hypothetical protein [Lachnospiraceae bacterium]